MERGREGRNEKIMLFELGQHGMEINHIADKQHKGGGC